MNVYQLGILIAAGAITASIHHLNQSFSTYWDFVAFAMVFGGLFAVSIMILPWSNFREVFQGYKVLLLPKPQRTKLILQESLQLIITSNQGKRDFKSSLKNLPGRILNDGSELMQLGFQANKIEEILSERVFQASKRGKHMSNTIRSLAKYPPAFGLIGTVLGLVNLMRNISGGADAGTTGIHMSVALVATCYGLLVANFMVAPAAEYMMQKNMEQEEDAQLALHGVMLAVHRVSLLEAQEMLNSYVSDHLRLDVIGQFQGDMSGGTSEKAAA